MDAYLKVVQELSKDFKSFELTKIPRSDNTMADALAALTSTFDPHLNRIIPVERIAALSIKLPRGVCHITELEERLEENNEPSDPMITDDDRTTIDR